MTIQVCFKRWKIKWYCWLLSLCRCSLCTVILLLLLLLPFSWYYRSLYMTPLPNHVLSDILSNPLFFLETPWGLYFCCCHTWLFRLSGKLPEIFENSFPQLEVLFSNHDFSGLKSFLAFSSQLNSQEMLCGMWVFWVHSTFMYAWTVIS